MLDTGGGGGGTPWESMTLDLMQRLIQNPDIEAQWQLVEAWNKSAQLLGDHLYQMQEYRNNLAAVWPPQKSAAAAAYLDRLDTLIRNLNQTYEASIANQRAFAVATGSIDQAQAKMHKIYQEYQSNRTTLEAFAAKSQQTGMTSHPGSAAPPVAPSRQEELRLQAVKLLSSVSTDLAEAQSQIVKPTPFAQYRKKDKDSTPVGDDGELTAPSLPRITPSVSPSRDASKSTHTTAASAASTPDVDARQPGLVLGGFSHPAPQPATSGIDPISPALSGGTIGQAGPGFPPPSAGLFPHSGQPVDPTAPDGGRSRGVPREGTIGSGSRPPESAVRATKPGSVIGALPSYGGGRQGAGRPGTRRINPIGGIIGSGDRPLGSRRDAGPGGVSAGGVYGQAPAGRHQGRRQEDSKPWDPDNPWETAMGVDPVVRPAPEQPIDPGPAIGLT